MSGLVIAALSLLGLAYLAFALPAFLQFRSYCERVAKATGRSRENQSLSTNEDGANAFEREQYRKLLNGEYKNLGDPALVLQGQALARKLRFGRWLTIGLIVAVAAPVFWPR
jgi:hypothetical protein